MAHCNHNHKEADKWTNIATIGEGLSSALSNFYWGVSLANLAYESTEDDTSNVSMYVGSVLMLLALGSMYTHRKLNTYHQQTEVSERLTDLLEEDFHAHDVDGHTHAHLSKFQKAALVADFVTHTGDVSGAITAGVDLITKLAIDHALPQWGRALVQCGATLFGASSAVASVRSCKDAILAQNNHTHAPH